MPTIDVLNPEECLLAWSIELTAQGLDEASIREVFEWVEDKCDVLITQLMPPAIIELTEQQTLMVKPCKTLMNYGV